MASFFVHCILSVLNTCLVHSLKDKVLLESSWNLTRMFFLIISPSKLDMYHMVSITRPLGPISLKPCVHSRCYSFASVFMNLYQNICLVNVFQDQVQIWIMWGQKLGHISLVQISLKPYMPYIAATVLLHSSWTFIRMFVLIIDQSDLKLGYEGLKLGH